MREAIKVLLTVYLSVLCASIAEAQDSLSVISRLADRAEGYRQFVRPYTTNPALMRLRYKTSLSTIDMVFDLDRKKDQISPRDGKGHLLGRIEAGAFLKTSPKTQTWGSASYTAGRIRERRWNSASDFDRIYPYFHGDTVGGDLSHEKYAFTGGVAHDLYRGQVGIEISYQAQHEYRTIDPRPRNITSDFVLNAGVSQEWIRGYLSGIDVGVEVYKQVDDVSIYHPLGAVSQILMSGLGNTLPRFGQPEVSVYYRGRSLRSRLTLIPLQSHGWHASASYDYTHTKRILASLNGTPVNALDNHSSALKLGYWSKESGRSTWGINANTYFNARRGRDNIVGDPSGGEYPIEGSLPIFGRNDWGSLLTFTYEWKHRWLWQVNPTIGYHNTTIEVAYPAKHLKDNFLDLGLKASATRQRGDVALLSVNVEGGYRHHVAPALSIPRALVSTDILSYIDHTFTQGSASSWRAGLGSDYSHRLTSGIALRGTIYYRMTSLSTGKFEHLFSASIGLIF